MIDNIFLKTFLLLFILCIFIITIMINFTFLQLFGSAFVHYWLPFLFFVLNVSYPLIVTLNCVIYQLNLLIMCPFKSIIFIISFHTIHQKRISPLVAYFIHEELQFYNGINFFDLLIFQSLVPSDHSVHPSSYA